MNGRVTGKRILVTGGATGLGAAISRQLHSNGAELYIADIADAAGIELAADLGCNFIHLDVASEQSWKEAIEFIKAASGALDGLVNNAGIAASNGPEDIENIDLADLHRIFSVNVDGTVLGCKYAIPLMAEIGGGSIVNLSSIAALVPTDFLLAYGASKATVRHITKSVALHCANKGYAIRCNSVHPGNVMTEMMQKIVETKATEVGISVDEMATALLSKIPFGKWQEPSDIAAAVVYLLSDEARFVTGTKIVVDGGMTLTN